ncbi:hypothetical protein AAE478_007890 [Parahypoxylon ruwenzoriense]
MSSLDDGSDPQFTQISDPTTHKHWEWLDPVAQGVIEKVYFEDGATIHFDRLPTLQPWASLFLIGDNLRGIYVTNKVVAASIGCQRRLTAEEVDATSEHATRSIRYIPYIPPIALSAAFALTWKGRRFFRVPFYTPRPPAFNPRIFPSKALPHIKGQNAIIAWHLARFTAYSVLSWLGSFFFFHSMAESSYEAHLLRDPRLVNMMQDIKKNAYTVLRKYGSPSERRNLRPRPGIDTPDSSQDTGAPQESGRDTFPSLPRNTFNGSAMGSGSGTGASAPRPSWGQNTQSQAPPRRYPESGSRNTDDLDLFDDDDDASPVSASSRRADVQQIRDTQGGSAWDRIRQQSQPDRAQWEQGDSSGEERGWARLRQDRARNPQENSPRAEGFSYSKQDEDRESRNYEREQAQKDFDALLESERRGGSRRQ